MNKFFFAFILSTLSLHIIAQNVILDWAKNIGGPTDERVHSTVVDDSSNVYITGYYTGTVDFDPGPGIYDLTSAGNYDIFICKLNVDGDFIWAKSMGGSSFDAANFIALDNLGNIYTTGYFDGTADFDPGPSIFNLTTSGIRDIFVSKLNGAGDFIWAKKMGGINTDEGTSLAIDNSGNIFITGTFGEPADFDPGPGTFTLTPAGGVGFEIFIAKLNSSGNFSWAVQMGGTGPDYPFSIALDVSGNIYSSGYFTGTADFNPGAGINNLTSFGMQDVFLSKLNSSGSFLWAKQIGGTADERGSSISIDATGNVYLAGVFENTADFDPGAGVYNLTPAYFGRKIYVCKLTALGNFIWAQSIGGVISNPWRCERMTLDGSGNVFTTGDFGGGTYDFDIGPDTLNLSTGYGTVFISQIDTSGNFKYATQIPEGTSYKDGYTIDIDDNGFIYVAGYFRGTSDFDPGDSIFNLSATGSDDIFISKMHFCWPTNSIVNEAACTSFISPSGNYIWTSSGTYTDTIPGTTGCDSIMTVNLTINSADISVSNSGATLSSNASSATYQWLDCDNFFAPISGETNQNYTATANGSYAVEVTENGCIDTSGCLIVSSVSIKENNMLHLKTYPNPTDGVFYLELNSFHSEIRIIVTNIYGQTVNSKIVSNSNRIILNLEGSKGMYFIETQTEDGQHARLKVLKN